MKAPKDTKPTYAGSHDGRPVQKWQDQPKEPLLQKYKRLKKLARNGLTLERKKVQHEFTNKI